MKNELTITLQKDKLNTSFLEKTIYRDLCIRLVAEMPDEDLSKLFVFKIDPNPQGQDSLYLTCTVICNFP